MRNSKLSPTQIAKFLKEFDYGKSVAEMTRDHGVCSPVFYKWRSKYAGMSGKELKRIKLEEENSKLKQMYATLALDHQMAKDIIEKSSEACRKRSIGKDFAHCGISRAYRVLNVSKTKGRPWNHKCVHRVYRALGLSLRRMVKYDFMKHRNGHRVTNQKEGLFEKRYKKLLTRYIANRLFGGFRKLIGFC